MAKKVFQYRGKTIEELQALSLQEFMELLPARQRRSLKRGFTDPQKSLLKQIRAGDANIKTHCRDLIILPEMMGKKILVFRGNAFEPVTIEEEMIGHFIGEFVPTRKNVQHSAPGIGATKSSSSLSVK
ncbi:MAG TPA: 30S ribosomal protein S19 [Candidatus Nanoarchaeia archaeon]|nr:30S ribosomal protein S19 [Candidatus Nanoarchaeia archaeon]